MKSENHQIARQGKATYSFNRKEILTENENLAKYFAKKLIKGAHA